MRRAEAVYRAQDLDAVLALFHPDVVIYWNGQKVASGLEEARRFHVEQLGFGEAKRVDFQLSKTLRAADGDTICVEWASSDRSPTASRSGAEPGSSGRCAASRWWSGTPTTTGSDDGPMDVTGNRFCSLFGCRWPIQLAGMARVTTPELAAAVSEAGGLGMVAFGARALAVAGRRSTQWRGTSEPVGATFIGKFLDPDTFEHAVAHLPVVELFWVWPDPALVRPGVITGWQVGTVAEAKAAVDAGCSYVIAQGIEAGGHVRGTVPVLELVRKVRAAVDVPVIGAGGIGTAGDVVTVLKAGADGVRIGTRFVAAHEADVHPEYVAHLVGGHRRRHRAHRDVLGRVAGRPASRAGRCGGGGPRRRS